MTGTPGTAERFELVADTLGPLIGAASSLASRLIAGAIDLSQARAELRGILVVGAQRIDAYDEIWAERDKREQKRIADETTKP